MNKLHKLKNIDVNIISNEEDIKKRRLNGKAIVHSEDSSLTFIENAPRKSYKRIFRTNHISIRDRENGTYSATMIFDLNGVVRKEELMCEIRQIYEAAQQNEQKKQSKNGN